MTNDMSTSLLQQTLSIYWGRGTILINPLGKKYMDRSPKTAKISKCINFMQIDNKKHTFRNNNFIV